jgi:hypothetical protein
MSRPNRTPAYCLHKATGQAVVRIDGKDYYLGKHGSPESRAEYDRLIAEWLGNGRRLAPLTTGDGQTVAELVLSYWRWAEGYYRDEHGEPSGELENVRTALKPLRRLYGHTLAAVFGARWPCERFRKNWPRPACLATSSMLASIASVACSSGPCPSN